MNKKTYSLKSPAKINIGLYVHDKRPDGYHNIETIFYPVKVHDIINLMIGETDLSYNKITVKANPELGLNDKKNICYKAVTLFFEQFRIQKKYEIEIIIKKRIPVGAGLGGGSSNAAAVLKVLAKYFKKENNVSKIKNIALKLGSDVPFFLLGKPAYAASRGEKLTPLPLFKINYKILIVNPNIHISTKWAYKKLNYKLQITNYKFQGKHKLKNVQRFDVNDTDKFQNDFEEIVFKKYPEIKKIKERMYKQGAALSLMTGSGSSVFGLFKKLKRFNVK